MYNQNKLRRRISSLTVIPTLLISSLILTSFYHLQNRQVNLLEHQKFALAEQLTAIQGAELRTPTDQERLASSLLAIEPLRRVSLISGSYEQVASAGLPRVHTSLPGPQHFAETPRRWRQGSIRYASIPLPDPLANDDSPRWVLIEMDSAPFKVLRHQALIALLLISFCALLSIAWLARRLQASILNPVDKLQRGLNRFLTGRNYEPIAVGDDSELQDLADTIGELAKKQQLEREEMQTHLEEYTQELRESLETVEVQNIELDMARKTALQSSRVKSEFLANASHELRTPLNGILGFASLLLRTDLTDQQTDYLSTIEQSAQGLLTIINDILDISRLETGDLVLDYKPVSIHRTIEEVLKIHAPSAHEKKLRLITLVDPHVPENLLGDGLRLKQVIGNLISNAVKFSDRGHIVIRVNVLGETDDQIHLKFSVSDAGIGLTPEQQENLFDSFSQADSAENRMSGGTGLGLAIARGLVHRMQGEIGVDSETGRGSTFWFTARLGINSRETAGNLYNGSLTGVRALVYDNNDVSRMEVTHLMSNWGAVCVETDQLEDVSGLVARQGPSTSIQIAILDAQSSDTVFDREQLRECVENLNTHYHLPVVIIGLPNVCRMLETVLEKLQATALPRPVSHYQLHRVVCTQLGVSTAPVPADTGGPRLRLDTTPKILAVDDNAANLRLVTELLKEFGAHVETASNGEAAIELCSKRRFDLILMDIQMPGMDGLEATRRLRGVEPEGQRTPVVALTAHAVNEQQTRLLLAGMDDYLSKPVSDSELRQIVHRWTSRRESKPAYSQLSALPAAEPPKNAVFDLSQALDRAGQKRELAQDMFTMLQGSLDDTAENIKAAIEDNDMATLRDIVHKLYGGCCYCGVPALCEAAASLDARLNQPGYSDIEASVDNLLRRIEELQEWAGEHDLNALFDQKTAAN